MRAVALAFTLAALLAVEPTANAGATAAPAAPVRVKLTTSDGVILLELDPAHAPLTVANFVGYVKERHYDGTIFHRVIPGFMVQGGGFTTQPGVDNLGNKTVRFIEKPTRAPIKLEANNGLGNVRGAIAMARTDLPDSATSQFFINLVDNSAARGPRNLDTLGGGYAVFGRVIEGMEVVDKIAAIPTGPGGPFRKDVPFRNVTVIKAEVVPAPKAAKAAAPTGAP